jgi:hypothetical protein
MEISGKRITRLFALFFILLAPFGAIAVETQKDSYVIELDQDYDARIFLSRTQASLFNRLYPDFGQTRLEKDWEWKDVDPLGLFTPEENRKMRRDLFLY